MTGEIVECSRAGCRAQAEWAIQWRNPRIHSADRRKTWVACGEHVGYLRDFLRARDFPVTVAALSGDVHTGDPGHARADALAADDDALAADAGAGESA